MQKYGTLLEGLNGKKVGKAVYIAIPIVSMLRQYLLALSIVMLIDKPQLTIMAFTYTSQFVLMFEFYWMPRKDRKT
jgi:hypothetical protein